MLPKRLKYESNLDGKLQFWPLATLFLILGVCCLGLGIAFFSLQNEIRALYQSLISRGWSRTEGKIIKTFNQTKSITGSSSKNSGIAYVPKVKYSFQVEDQIFMGERMNFAAEEKYFWVEQQSTEYVSSVYQFNQKIEVFYDPHNPQESTLSQEYVYDPQSYKSSCCCGIIGIFFGLFFWSSRKNLMKLLNQALYGKISYNTPE